MANAKLKDDAKNEQDLGDELAPGSTLMHGQYTIDSFLNAGGFGITYSARDSLDRRVVIKECFPGAFCRRSTALVTARSRAHQSELASIVRLFVQEARSMSKLDHPNIVGVHQVFEENNTAYMALDFVEGCDLLDVIENGTVKLTPEEIETILRKVLDAITFVHAQGLLHRDISPDNILLAEDKTPVLIDFGAAREQASKKSRVLSAMRVVKDGYSPQEFYVSGSEQGPYSDLYALGATFYHLITGKLPPDAQTRLSAMASGEKDPYRALLNRLPTYRKPFLHSIDTAMAILPRDRIPNAEAWIEMLDSDQPIPRPRVVSKVLSKKAVSKKAPAAAASTSPRKSNKGLLLTSVGVGALLAAIVVASQFNLQSAEPTEQAATVPTATAPAETVQAETVQAETVPAPTAPTASVAIPGLTGTADAPDASTGNAVPFVLPTPDADTDSAAIAPSVDADAPASSIGPLVATETPPATTVPPVVSDAPAAPSSDAIAALRLDSPNLPAQITPPALSEYEPIPNALDSDAAPIEPSAPDAPAAVDQDSAIAPSRTDIAALAPIDTPPAPQTAPSDAVSAPVAENPAPEAEAPASVALAPVPVAKDPAQAPEAGTVETTAPALPAAPVENFGVPGMTSVWATTVPADWTFGGEGGGAQVFAVNGQPVTSRDGFDAVLRQSTGLPTSSDVTAEITLGASPEDAVTENWDLPVVQNTTLASGLAFQTKIDDGSWVTKVTNVPEGLDADLQVGDVIFAHMGAGEFFTQRTSLPRTIALMASGQADTSIAVIRAGSTLATTLPFAQTDIN